jgi:hypothetical protein
VNSTLMGGSVTIGSDSVRRDEIDQLRAELQSLRQELASFRSSPRTLLPTETSPNSSRTLWERLDDDGG